MPSQTIQQLYAGLLTNASAALYTTPASTKALVKEIHLFNSGAGVNLVQIRRVGTDDTAHDIVYESMAAKATLNLPFSYVLVAAEKIHGLATNTDEVHCTISGITIV